MREIRERFASGDTQLRYFKRNKQSTELWKHKLQKTNPKIQIRANHQSSNSKLSPEGRFEKSKIDVWNFFGLSDLRFENSVLEELATAHTIHFFPCVADFFNAVQ